MKQIELPARLGRFLDGALARAPRCTRTWVWCEDGRDGLDVCRLFCVRVRGQRRALAFAPV